jgi:dTDP-4-amino-4,6-dideoxy-D-glucose acyltransferase
MFYHDYDKFIGYWRQRGVCLSDFVREELMIGGYSSHLDNVIHRNNSLHKGRNGDAFLGLKVRIDDFCLFSLGDSKSVIGSYVHIAAYCFLSLGHGFIMGDFSGLSTGVKVFTSSSDYSGEYMTHPPIPMKYRNPTTGPVLIGKHCVVGAGSVIMPNVMIPDGVAIGALSFVDRDLDPWGIYAGCPVRRIKDRKKGCVELEKKLLCDGDVK